MKPTTRKYFILGLSLLISIKSNLAQTDGISVNQQKVGVNNTNPQKTLEISAENDPTLRLSQGSSTTDYFDLIDATTTSAHLRKYTSVGNSLIDIDAYPLDGTSESGIRLFRAVNTSNRVSLQIMQGNNTAAVNHLIAGNRDSYFSAHTGKVGIGITTPTEKLDIAGNIAIDNSSFLMGRRLDGLRHQLIGLDNNNTLVVNRSSLNESQPSNLVFIIGDNKIMDIRNSDNLALFRIDEATGNIGFGNNTPLAKYYFTDQGTSLAIKKWSASLLTNATDITGGLNSSIRMGAIDLNSNAFGGAVIQAYSDNAPSFKGNIYLDAGYDANASIYLRTGLNTKMIVKKDGKVGIGTTTPTVMLDVAGTSRALGFTAFNTGVSSAASFERSDGAAMATGGAQQSSVVFDQSFNYEIRRTNRTDVINKVLNSGTSAVTIVGSNGYVGINESNPSHQFSVNGTAAKPGGGTWLATSDRRLKKDINDYNEGLDKILALNPVTYRYNGQGGISDTTTEYVGLIAQEVQNVDASMVKSFEFHNPLIARNQIGDKIHEDAPAEEWLAVDASPITYMLVNAIKEQQKMIEEMRADNEQLKAMVTDILVQLTNGENLLTKANSISTKAIAENSRNSKTPTK